MINNCRNICILAHINHGKSTLADRFLEITGTIGKSKMKEQFLDSMDLEREKGITIKMHPVRLVWRPQSMFLRHPEAEPKDLGRDSSVISGDLRTTSLKGSEFILNLIDTPGHIDFSYETSRALACCEGAVLLVDVKQGIQAQTLFNLEQAQKQWGQSPYGDCPQIIGVVNKIDLATQEQVNEAKKELAGILNTSESKILAVSAKTGKNVQDLLETIISEIPSPKITTEDGFKALIFDSSYDLFSGVVAYVRVFSGEITRGEKINLLAGNCVAEVKEVGYFKPQFFPADSLKAGEIGYIKTGIKTPSKVKVGDTLCSVSNCKPLPGYKDPQPVLYMSLYPAIADDFDLLKEALLKLKLNDPAFDFQVESQMALGRGFRCGFLGALHAEIAIRRLKSEFNIDLIATSPQVVFKAVLKNGKQVEVSSPVAWPDKSLIQETYEPRVKLTIIVPNRFFNVLFRFFPSFDINLESTQSLSFGKSLILARAPLREIVSGSFYDKIKSSTEGYASFSFEPMGYFKSDLEKVDILIAGKTEEAFAKILPKKKIFSESKKFLQKLKEVLPAQQFALSLQAAVGGKVIARETIRALRKDVTAPLYGGDITRRKKLLEIQKKGKQKLKKRANVHIPAQAFLDILKNS